MNKKISYLARNKFVKLLKQYNNFRIIFLDNWRGFRFVYDTPEVQKYPGKSFYKSQLYKLLKDEKPGRFSAGLYLANKKERKFFGDQVFLNCKTYKQYQNCYVNFLLKKAYTKKQIFEELRLIRNLKIIYSKTGSEKGLERKFRLAVVGKVLVKAKKSKREAVLSYLKKNKGFFDGS